MKAQSIDDAATGFAVPTITLKSNLWIAIPFGFLALAVATGNLLLLDYVHVISAVLWTGADIFMAFLLGPILTKINRPSRKEVSLWLMPKLIFYMPTMSTVTIVAGYFLGAKVGIETFNPPVGYSYVAIIVLVLILIVQGYGMLLPHNIRIYRQLKEESPDYLAIETSLKNHSALFLRQALVQVAIIFVMANIATGFPL